LRERPSTACAWPRFGARRLFAPRREALARRAIQDAARLARLGPNSRLRVAGLAVHRGHPIGSWRRISPRARLAIVTHPSLGLPPPNETAGFPDAATRLRAATTRLGARALEIAVERDPSIRDRYDEIGLRHLLRDTEIFIDRIALAVASNDPAPVRSFIDQVVPIYRRRRVPMDDLGQLFEGLRSSIAAFLVGPEAEAMHAAIDAGIAQMRWNRRVAGDARKRNRLLQAIYKGA
jgi:hypothetical protein